jgi:hypothetical protein
MSAESREFAEAASMAMQVMGQRPITQQPDLSTLINLSIAYSLIEIAEALSTAVAEEMLDVAE